MKPIIYLCLTHDWELRGDGSGDIEQIQFAPLRKLLRIYKLHGVRASFNPDVMQQLAFRNLGTQYLELQTIADTWDEHMIEAFRQEHDIQLHLHTQWLNAQYDGGKWSLTADWSILNYNAESTFAMVAESKKYLENLLQPLDGSYQCIAFRAGALAVAPSLHLLSILMRLGIVLDVSIAGGLYVDTSHLQIDYRRCEESFLPFYPQMEDARKISDKPQEIVCVPIHSFYGSRRQVFRQQLEIIGQRVKLLVTSAASESDNAADTYARRQWRQRSHSSPLRLLYDKGVLPYLTGKYLVSDTARLNYPQLREMLTSIRYRARASGWQEVPVVLTNHPKEMRNFAALERFIGEAAQSEDIKFITLTELARKLAAREFPIKKREAVG